MAPYFPRKRLLTAWLLLGLLVVGCSPFSSEVKKQVRDQPSFGAIRARPSAYRGRMVMLGGTIAQTKNLKDVTLIEVLQERLDSSDRPIPSDKIGGRFLVRTSTFLDPSVYSKGRDITVVGRVAAPQPGVIGEKPYTYPVIAATHIHLWSQYTSADYAWGYPGMGWGWGYPYMGMGMGWGMGPWWW
ncbi:Outer membrane protein slp [Methylacidimicrobium cyclopophantes]|uniref:Outer membrane protein slp n=1 Tax=Methylacidimicrobium cyclopophantes TaxID=1041766 RepID=A0A5E6MDA5_9BACT|nr:Slp family lipoprotein [Methylacidimicrobium cyclopophantes]VVM07161.1 Outer membrane protein slp [Methylacidimicrobium cyclopophantes]